MKTFRSKTNFISKPPARVQTMAKKYGILEIAKKATIVYEDEAQAIFDNMGTEPDSTRKGYINTLVKSLKDGGVWAELDRFVVLAGATSDSVLLDWINPSIGANNATLVSAPTFTADEGYTGNGTNSYIDSQYIPSAGTNYSQDSASFGAYIRNARTTSNENCSLGQVTSGGKYLRLYPYFTGGFLAATVNNSTNITEATTSTQGFSIASRTDLSNVYLYKNGTQYAKTSPSVGVPTGAVAVLANNFLGSPQDFAPDQISVYFFGGGLTSGQVTIMTNSVEAYMDALGKGVI